MGKTKDQDLTSLGKDVAEKDIVSQLGSRFEQDEIYSRIGQTIIVAINPSRQLDICSDSNAKNIGNAVKDGKDRDAHVFELAANSYFDMVRDKEDQSLLFLGESGSGKSESCSLAVKQLAMLSKSKSKDNKTAGRLLKALQVLEAFGHARTINNDNSSRFGKYIEMQFNTRGKLAGAKISDYLLDKTRVSNTPYDERTFHIFYYLLAGSTSEEKNDLGLRDAKHYRMLAESKHFKIASIDDASKFKELKSALKAAGFKDKYQTQIFSVLAAILHLSNIQFEQAANKDDAATIKNPDVLEDVADLLGVRSHYLENALVYKTKLIKNEICNLFLDPEEAAEHRDLLCQTLYSLLWTWIVETMNKRLVADDYLHHIGLADMFGVENLKDNYFYQLLCNYTAERFHSFMNEELFDHEINDYRSENVKAPQVSYLDNSGVVSMLYGKPTSILKVFDEEAAKAKKRTKMSAIMEGLNETHRGNEYFISFPKKSKSYMFGVRHQGTDVYYEAKDFFEVDSERLSPDFVTLFRGGPDTRPSKNNFVYNIFGQKSIDIEKAADHGSAVVDALQTNAPRRNPSVRRKKGEKPESKQQSSGTVFSEYSKSLDLMFEAIGDTHTHYVLCIKPSNSNVPGNFDSTKVGRQVQSFGLRDIIKIRALGYGNRYDFDEFVERYVLAVDSDFGGGNSNKERSLAILGSLGVVGGEYILGNSKVYLTESASRKVDMKLRAAEKEERKRLKEKNENESNADSYLTDDQSDIGNSDMITTNWTDTDFTDTETNNDDNRSTISYGSEFSITEDEKNQKNAAMELHIEEEEEPISGVRKAWLLTTAILTWWIPKRCLEWNGMKRADIQQAWREKVALCILIMILCGLTLFFITGFVILLCPSDKMFTPDELSGFSSAESKLYVGVHGRVFDYTTARNAHSGGPEFIDEYGGKIATAEFPRKPDICGFEVDPTVDYLNKSSFPHPSDTTMAILSEKNKAIFKGYVAFGRTELKKDYMKPEKWYVIFGDRVYDFTLYRQFNLKYFPDTITAAILRGEDGTETLQRLSAGQRKQVIGCMNDIHMAGIIDTRDSFQCKFAESILLASTIVLVAIMVIKFLSALQLRGKSEPENYDRFVLIQVPCYTEGEESLRRTLDSLATLRYDDKRKLLFIICDGNIIGSGNDRATWRIVLDILGVDPAIDPPKLSFQSLGEGNKQHNMGKVYTGLYDCAGHLVPYLVVVKVGKDNETRRPGNRGKRDSQMILMRFLQKVHYDEQMSPLELEMFHQMKNVIGVDPTFYEFALMVDADTEVMPDSLNRLVSAMVHDAKIVGLCGETTIANEHDSVITMMQVYEYYISHHLAKAFESLFGSVTCLPGCFCMYRIRTPSKSIPLLTSKQVITDYEVNDVDTLHKKNLLSLGEDRYLTTLMLKHFPNMKISFTSDAQCRTYVPDRWNILMSQRRRWINSTVHNLLELLLLPQLCGFCCFSMRFVVFFDLFATLVMPATMGYLVYLVYLVASSQRVLPIVSIVLLGAGYGLQIIIFLIHRKFEHIGWLFIYLLALPFFTFILPLYAFWHFDDFSWGNTRVVVGERGGKKQIVDEEPFDPSSIPMKKWSEYESEMWEKDSQISGASHGNSVVSQQMPPQSMHGSMYGSQVASQQYYMAPAMVPGQPGYSPSEAMMAPAAGQGRPMSMMMPQGMAAVQQQLPIGTTSPKQQARSNGLPTNDQITAQIKSILAAANLMTVTKKQVRDELAAFFGMDMNPKRDFINKVIEDVLQGKL